MRPAQLSPSNLLGYSIPTTNRHDNLQILGHMDHRVADDSHLSKTGVSVCQGVSLTHLWVVRVTITLCWCTYAHKCTKRVWLSVSDMPACVRVLSLKEKLHFHFAWKWQNGSLEPSLDSSGKIETRCPLRTTDLQRALMFVSTNSGPKWPIKFSL